MLVSQQQYMYMNNIHTRGGGGGGYSRKKGFPKAWKLLDCRILHEISQGFWWPWAALKPPAKSTNFLPTSLTSFWLYGSVGTRQSRTCFKSLRMLSCSYWVTEGYNIFIIYYYLIWFNSTLINFYANIVLSVWVFFKLWIYFAKINFVIHVHGNSYVRR